MGEQILPIKVVHVGYQAEEYGIGTFLRDLVEYQSRHVPQIEVAVAFHTAGPNIGKYIELGISVHTINVPNAKSMRSFHAFRSIFRNYDIVNLHTFSPWAFFAALIETKKVIYTFHGSLGLRGRWMDIIVRLFHKAFMNRFSFKITFASQSALTRYLSGFKCKLDPDRMTVFPYGINVERIVPQKTRAEVRVELGLLEGFVFGSAARMDPNKKLERLIDAISLLPQSGSIKLILMGKGDDNYEKQLMMKAESLEVGGNIRMIGFRNDAWDIMNALDLFVLPSQNEPFGLALVEAMALGVPCAVFEDGGGVVEIIGENGFIVKDQRELSEVILRLSGDEKISASMAKSVKKRAAQFSIVHTAGRLHEIYRQALERQSNA